MADAFYARPNSRFGYWTGGMSDGPLWKGQGSGMGPKSQGTSTFPPGLGGLQSGGWEPTVIYLLILIVAEMVVFGAISRLLR